MIKNVLSIAGSDPSGGAGIQADLKSFAARGTYGMAAITALTAQNTQGVAGVHIAPAGFVRQQIDVIFADIRVDAVKIGMIANAEIATVIAQALFPYPELIIVLDPVMVAKGGAKLLQDDASSALIKQLIPLATVMTPNLPEAADILGCPAAVTREDMQDQAQALLQLGAKAVLLKGGHLEGSKSPDLLAMGDQLIWIEGIRHQTKNTHGTGCSLSSALAAELAKGKDLENAARIAKLWLTEAIIQQDNLTVGSGHGPVNHFHALW
jgi:hydroxymethylpyrimidine/phosphomethylpyrimidine kinase